jgi:probable F420-dependent oxidoreductase
MIDMQELPALARKAEELGFEGVNLGEHLITFGEQYDNYDYSKNKLIRWYPHTHWPDPWVQIGALSQVTNRLKFLNTIYVLPMQDPFHAAKAIATAANLCDGRLILGAGVGWQAAEFELVGQDFHNRGRRADEMIDVMQRLWEGEIFSYEGEYYRFPDLQMSPRLFRPLPVYVGGQSPAAFARAARHDGYVGGQLEIEDVPPLMDGLRQARSKQGKRMEDFEVIICLYENSAENFERCRELGVTQIYKDAFCDENGMASTMTLSEKLDDMERFAQAYMA